MYEKDLALNNGWYDINSNQFHVKDIYLSLLSTPSYQQMERQTGFFIFGYIISLSKRKIWIQTHFIHFFIGFVSHPAGGGESI